MNLAGFLIVRKILIGVIRFYQRFISPFFLPCCRFTPTCSEYSRQALENYGLGRGLWLSLKRILRCHPFCPGGYDPV